MGNVKNIDSWYLLGYLQCRRQCVLLLFKTKLFMLSEKSLLIVYFVYLSVSECPCHAVANVS